MAMTRFEKIETPGDCAASSSLLAAADRAHAQPLDWWQVNLAHPFINGLVVEPVNALAWAYDAVTHQKEAHRLKPLAAPLDSNDGAAVVCQGFGSAVGSILPYAMAGRFAGNGLRMAGAKLELEGAFARFAQSEKAAQIVGSGVYDGMRETRPGESHLRNGAAGAANFTILEIFGRSGNSVLERAANRFGTGALASFASTAVARPETFDLHAKRSDTDFDMGRQLFANGLLNVVLPGAQHGVRALHDKATVKLGMGMPIDRFVKSNETAFAHQFSNACNSKLLEANRWAHVQPGASVNSYRAQKDLITLKDGSDLHALKHELQHRVEAKTKVAEAGFARAADLLKTDADKAWDTYRAVRLAQEVRAEIAPYRGDNAARYSEAIEQLKKTIPGSSAIGGDTYETLWKKEFQEFERSGGRYRPKIDYSSGYKTFYRENDRLFEHLSPRFPAVDKTLNQIQARYDISIPQLALALKSVNEIVEPGVVHPTKVDVDRLAMQALELIAHPHKVKQGKNPTCGPAAIEYCTYLKHPENASDLISQVVRLNQFETMDRSQIVVNGLNVVREKYWDRNHANQIFQNTAVNVHWQRKHDLTPWLSPNDGVNISLRPGLTRYQRQWTRQINESPYRLLDYSRFPPAPVHKRIPGQDADLSCPLFTMKSVADAHEQINGTVAGGITLCEKFSNSRELADVLAGRSNKSQLPVIAWVDVRQPLFNKGVGPVSEFGGHAVVIKSYDHENKTVSIFNPWGETLNDVRIKDLYQATKEFDPGNQANRRK